MTAATFFALDRIEDETGISGTGVVAWAVNLHENGVFLLWDTDHTPATIAWYPNLDAINDIHGHEGKTRLVGIDVTSRIEDLLRQLAGPVEDALDRLLVVMARLDNA
jgi:hypothetical protein